MKQEAVAKSFKKCGISSALFGKEYDAVLEEKVVNFRFSDGAAESHFCRDKTLGPLGRWCPTFLDSVWSYLQESTVQ